MYSVEQKSEKDLEVKLGKGTLNFKSQGEICSAETHHLRVGMCVCVARGL
jgi:hypothetical protein